MFILKKLISQFFLPVPLCLELFIIGLVLLLFTQKQRAGKLIISIGMILFTFLSYEAIPNILLKPLESQYSSLMLTTPSDPTTDDIVPSVKWIVVLGGGNIPDPKIPVTSQLSETSMVRLIEAVRLHNRIPESKLILSGGGVFGLVPEAETMSTVAKAIGVNQEDLILETDSKDTEDEARLIKPIVGNDKFILVTSASHMPRSMGMFRKLGMYPIAAPTDYMVKERQGISPSDFFPNSGSLRKAEGVIHEYLGIFWAKLRGQI
ncbi:MAG: YdcF family protein [Candidatus Brocadiaceae bacterium]|nr:YdcF family protein [Candidatus Brocadiaceae bacterium]